MFKFRNYFILFTILFLIFIVYVTLNNSSTNTLEELPVIKEKNDTKNSETEVKYVAHWDENEIISTKYSISSGVCGITSMTAPSYVDQDSIIFIDDSEQINKVISFNRNLETCKIIYQVENNNGIGNLVGDNNQLYWTEYDTTKTSNLEWEIKNLNLKDFQVKSIATGDSYYEVPPPTIRISNKGLSWIEYETDINTKIILSKLMHYDYKTNLTYKVEENILDESSNKNGIYHIMPYLIDSENYLLYKSLFNNGNKTFNLNLILNQNSTEIITEKDRIIDFIFNKDFVIYTIDNSLLLHDLKKSAHTVSLKYSTKSLTIDTPIFIAEDTIIFRSGVDQINILNINKRIVGPLTNFKTMTSKPIYMNNLISYGNFTSDLDKKELDFFVIEVK